jgi:hypothetical protein
VHDQFHPSRHFHISLVKRESLIFLLDERTHGSEREESSCVCVCECHLVLSSREREREREREKVEIHQSMRMARYSSGRSVELLFYKTSFTS